MRQQYHFRASDKGLLSWDVLRLIELSRELPVVEIQLSDVKEFEEEFWYDLGGARPTCRNVLEHASLIQKADLSYPIILCCEGRVMDGMHRVCKAAMLGQTAISAVQFPTYLEPDYVGIEADKLPCPQHKPGTPSTSSGTTFDYTQDDRAVIYSHAGARE